MGFLFDQKGSLWAGGQLSAEDNSWAVRNQVSIHWNALAMVVYLGGCWILGFLGLLLGPVFCGFALVIVLNTEQNWFADMSFISALCFLLAEKTQLVCPWNRDLLILAFFSESIIVLHLLILEQMLLCLSAFFSHGKPNKISFKSLYWSAILKELICRKLNSNIFVMNLKYQGNFRQNVIKQCIRTVLLTNGN